MAFKVLIRATGVKSCMKDIRTRRIKEKPCRRNFGRQGGGEKDVQNRTERCVSLTGIDVGNDSTPLSLCIGDQRGGLRRKSWCAFSALRLHPTFAL